MLPQPPIENQVRYILIIFSVSLFSLTVISCAKKSGSSSSSTTNTTTSDNTTTTSSGLYIAVGASGTLLTSSDGTTWTSRTSGTSKDINNVHYGNSSFVAVGDNGTLLSSTDGITWSDKTSNCGANDNESLWDVAYGGSTWVANGDNGSIYTYDESTCTARTSGTTVEFNELYYGNSTFVAIGSNGTILTSSDGTTWTSRWFDTTYDFYGGAYTASNDSGNIEFTVVGESGKLLSSSNGTTYNTVTSLSSLTTGNLFGIVRGGTTWVLVGASGYISTISDGERDVTTRTSGTTEHLRRVFYKE